MAYRVAIDVVLCRRRALWLWFRVEGRALGRWRHLPLILMLLLPLGARSEEIETADLDYTNAVKQALAGDWSGALTNASRAIVLKPDFAEPWFTRAAALQHLGDLPGGITNLTRFIALKPLPMAYFQRGMMEQHLDPHSPGALADYNEAIAIADQHLDPLKSVLVHATNYAIAFYNRGCWKRENGDTNGALTDFDRAIQFQPDMGVAYSSRAWTKYNRHDWTALADYSRAIELHSTNPNDFYMRGVLREYKGYRIGNGNAADVDGAIKDFEKAHQLDPTIKIPAEFLRLRDDSHDLWKQWYQWLVVVLLLAIGGYGLRIVRRRQLPLILALLLPLAASSRERERLETDYEKARSQALAGDWAGALTNANRAIYLQPYAAEPWILRAEAFQYLGNLPEAITNFSQAIALRPLASAYFLRGMIEQHLDPQSPTALVDYNEAVRLTERLTKQPPDPQSPVLNQIDYAGVFYNRGCWKGIHGDTDGALRDFDRAIQLNPELGLAYSCRAMIKMNRHDGAAALADFSRAIALHSTNPLDYYNRDRLLAHREGPETAGEDYTNAVKLAMGGDWAGALTNADRAIALQPNAGDGWLIRAQIFQSLGKFREAISNYNEAIRIIEPLSPNPTNFAEVFYARGRVELFLGDEGAIEDLTKAGQLNPALAFHPASGNPFGLFERPNYVLPELKWYQFMTWPQWQLMAVIVILGGYALRAVRRRREATSSGASGAGR